MKNTTNKKILPLSGYEPHFNPLFWNHFFDKQEIADDIRRRNNCWMYSVNDFLHTGRKRSQPGHTDPKQPVFNEYTCKDMLERIQKDVPLAYQGKENKKCKKYFYKIAYVVDPGNNYHFYRQDSNGLWSHKEGELPVGNLDATGNLIYNPRLADRKYVSKTDPTSGLNYTDFCGYLCVPSNNYIPVYTGTCDQCGGGDK